MEIKKDFYFLEVHKKGVVDSSSIIAIRDSKGLTCVEIGGGGEENIKQTQSLFEKEGLDILDIHTVIISHTHADHMGAIAFFKDMIPHMTIIDHEIDAPFLKENTLLNGAFDVDLVPKYFPGEKFDIMEFYKELCPISEAEPDKTVVEGDFIECGDYCFYVIHTPGHHPGHISLVENNHGILFVGDMLGLEIPFYTPSSGGVSGYLESIKKYREVGARSIAPLLIIPSHGALIENQEELLDTVVNKVKKREVRLLEALKSGPKSFTELLPEMFRHAYQHMFPGAAILASHLLKLEKEGIVVKAGEKYFFEI